MVANWAVGGLVVYICIFIFAHMRRLSIFISLRVFVTRSGGGRILVRSGGLGWVVTLKPVLGMKNNSSCVCTYIHVGISLHFFYASLRYIDYLNVLFLGEGG